jgi:hypothetical protein
MIVAHIDTEGGRGSIADLIESGKVVSYDGSTYEKAEQIYWALYYGRIKCDVVVLDTLTTLVDRYVRDVTLDPENIRPDQGQTWWSQRKKMRTNQDVWNIVNFGIGQLMSGVRNLPQPSIFLAHETERDDPTAEVEVDRHMPALTPKILKMVMAYSDLVMRIYKSPTPFALAGANWPANTRVLQLENTANAYTGVRLTPTVTGTLPQYIPDPTLAKLATAIGFLPKAMTVYGFPKVGKTVLACTMPE